MYEYDEPYAYKFNLKDLYERSSFIAATKDFIVTYLNDNDLTDDDGKLLFAEPRRTKIAKLYKNADVMEKKLLDSLKIANRQSAINFTKSVASMLAKERIKRDINAAREAKTVKKDDDGYYFLYGEIAEDDCCYWLYEADSEFIESKLQKSLKDIQEQFLNYFLREFIQKLKESKTSIDLKIIRGQLKPQHEFSSNSVEEFFANIRLSYRDQLRRTLTTKDHAKNPYAVKKGKKTQRAWSLGGSNQALENQEVTKNAARNDLVINLSNYELIYKDLNAYMTTINDFLKESEMDSVEDADFARWIKEILRHDDTADFKNEEGVSLNLVNPLKDDLKSFLTDLAYLMVGCEGQRNPASLVVVPMALDLIEAGKLSWKNAFNKEKTVAKGQVGKHKRHIKYGGGEIPMTMGKYQNKKEKEKNQKKKTLNPSNKEAKEEKPPKIPSEVVSCARTLQNHVGLFAIKKWNYPGKTLNEKNNSYQGRISELVRRHNTIVENWMKYLKVMDPEKGSDEQFNTMENYVTSFYGIK